MKSVRGYNFSRTFMGERVPQHVQNIVIKDFCQKNNFNFLLSATEYSMENSFYILNQLINNLKEIHGIVAYSIFQMPYNSNHRKKIFKIILKKKKKIFFACENLQVSTNEDVKRIDKIWNIKKISERCLKPKDLII
jgi:sporadic carbohydrate cluster protein (TIGR04323 family)